MTDSIFEQSLDRQIRAYADGGVQPFDRYAIAEDLIKSGVPRGRFAWLPALGRPALSPSLAIVVIGLLLALAAAIVVGALVLRMQLNQPPGRNGVIAYTLMDIAERPYNHLRMVNADGTNDHEVAQGAAPFYSFDGQTLMYFTGFGVDSTDMELIQANADGSAPHAVSGYRQTGFYPSPDGTLILMRDPDQDLRSPGATKEWFLLNVADGTRRLLIPEAPATQRYLDFLWSPDASQIAYSVMQEVTTSDNSGEFRAAIDIVDVATGMTRRLTSRPGTDSMGLAWSPDGMYLTYPGVPDGEPAPSLDGGTESFYPPLDIFLIGADGTGDTNATNSPELDQDPRWAPDGTAISYVSFLELGEEGVHALVQFVRGTDAVGEPLLGPTAHFTAWSPDAQQLLTSWSREGFSEIQISDRRFAEPPVTIVSSDFNIGMVSWQRLDP